MTDWFQLKALSEERQIQLKKTKAILEKYWIDVNHLLETVDDRLKLRQHIARLKYNLQKDPAIKSWFEVEKRVWKWFRKKKKKFKLTY